MNLKLLTVKPKKISSMQSWIRIGMHDLPGLTRFK